MFHVTLKTLIVSYLVVFLGGLFIVWLVGEVLNKRRERQSRKNRLVCQICGYVDEDRSENPLPECPECGRPNERHLVQDL